MPRGLKALFTPRAVAVIGASRSPGKVGHAVLRNLLYGCGERAPDRSWGFPGRIVPVNPHAEEILGLPVTPYLEKLEGPIDLAVLAIPAAQVPEALDAVGRRGAQAAIVLAAGTAQLGQEGRRLEEQLVSVARNTGTRVIGPNCTGLFTRLEGEHLLSASFFSKVPPPGPIALIAQSGAIAQALLHAAADHDLGLRHIVTLGEKVDVQDAELLRYLARDPEVKVIGLHVESLDDPRGFHATAREVSARKPLVVLHGGRTAAGMRAARGYEGLFGTCDASLEGALGAAGVHQVATLGEFMPALQALSEQPAAAGRRVAIVSNGGGTAVLAADAVSNAGLDVVPFRRHTIERLAQLRGRDTRNPLDLRGDASAEQVLAALDAVAEADEVDAILLVLTAQATTDPRELADALTPWHRGCDKPILAASVGFATERLLARAGIPELGLPEEAAAGLAALAARGAFERRSIRRRLPESTSSSW